MKIYNLPSLPAVVTQFPSESSTKLTSHSQRLEVVSQSSFSLQPFSHSGRESEQNCK